MNIEFTTYYNIEIQTSGYDKITDEMITWLTAMLGAGESSIDERDSYRATLFFKSTHIKPTMMRERVRECLSHDKPIYYIDVIYRFESEMTPDRFVYWADGREQEYIGHVIFEEDK